MVGGRGVTRGREGTQKKTFNDGITVIVAIILACEVKEKKTKMRGEHCELRKSNGRQGGVKVSGEFVLKKRER